MSEHEVRFALVMNGGVSLAVWMGGVTHEGTVALSHRDAGRPQDFQSIALRSLVDGHDGGERPSIRAWRGRDRQCRQQVFL